MRRILFTILLLSLLPFGAVAGPNVSRVAVIDLTCGADSEISDDCGRRNKAQLYQILANRGIDELKGRA